MAGLVSLATKHTVAFTKTAMRYSESGSISAEELSTGPSGNRSTADPNYHNGGYDRRLRLFAHLAGLVQPMSYDRMDAEIILGLLDQLFPGGQAKTIAEVFDGDKAMMPLDIVNDAVQKVLAKFALKPQTQFRSWQRQLESLSVEVEAKHHGFGSTHHGTRENHAKGNSATTVHAPSRTQQKHKAIDLDICLEIVFQWWQLQQNERKTYIERCFVEYDFDGNGTYPSPVDYV